MSSRFSIKSLRIETSSNRRMLSQVNRLKTTRDFDTVYRRGSHFKGRYGKLIIFDRGDDGPARVGIIVSAKRGNAVKRNRVKRLIREAFRSYLAEMKSGIDVTYIVWDPDFSLVSILGEIMKLMKEAGCIKPVVSRNELSEGIPRISL